MSTGVSLYVRSNTGIELRTGPATCRGDFTADDAFPKDASKLCRALEFSPDGRFLAWTNGVNVQVCRTSDRQVFASLARPKASHLKFSPKGTYLMTWEISTQSAEHPNGSPNLFIFKTATGEQLYAATQKRQTDWHPFWSYDETLVVQLVGGEALFMEVRGQDGEGLGTVTKRMGVGRNGSLSMAPNKFLAIYTPGAKSAPSICKIYQSDATTVVSTKSFFQADRVEMFWNKRGTGLLLLTSTEVDKSNNSYYGKQALHFMSTRGDSYTVALSKDGPIHSVAWSPKSTEFCVIYGFMPAKATVFNFKCDAVHQFEESAKNSIYYNPFGNILMLAGFGNLRGPVEVYELAGKTKKLLANLMAPDTTLLEWHPNGEYFLTATTAPRLRMANGWKVWHYSGALLHETHWPEGQELLEVAWERNPAEAFQEPTISAVKVQGIESSVPQVSSQAYRPPNARGVPMPAFVMPPPKPKKEKKQQGRKPSATTEGGENAEGTGEERKTPKPKKNNKANNGKKNGTNTTPRNGDTESPQNTTATAGAPATETTPTTTTTQGSDQESGGGRVAGPKITPRAPFDAEKAKRRKLIKKKLFDIQKLKEKQTAGEQLDKSQLGKIDSEANLILELTTLKIKN